jgi:Lrp/AsnC family transcriptional regulator for asnA, asnC and gidA
MGGDMGRSASNDSNNRNKAIDKIDCQIIEMLQKDGRLPNTVIARDLGISEATVRTRLNRLIQEEYIQIVAVSNPLKLGFNTVGNIRINVDIKKFEVVISKLKKLKACPFIVLTTGNADIYLEFLTNSIDELNELIFEKINKIDGVIRTDTRMILKFIKRRFDFGTGSLCASENESPTLEKLV